jgi:hypothetical protein
MIPSPTLVMSSTVRTPTGRSARRLHSPISWSDEDEPLAVSLEEGDVVEITMQVSKLGAFYFFKFCAIRIFIYKRKWNLMSKKNGTIINCVPHK